MKFLLTLITASVFASAALAHPGHGGHGRPPGGCHNCHNDGGDILLLASTTALFLLTLSHASAPHRYALMVEASPLAANYLTSGQGLDNATLVAAMLNIKEGNPSLSNDELALSVIEEANK
ncbi:MAG: hypothetical protein AABY64_02940 [Bdellovibrionota bacterium]